MIAFLVTFAALVSLSVLFFWTTAGIVGGDDRNGGEQGGQGEYRPWWDVDLGPEGSVAVKIILNLFFLMFACGTLFVPISKSGTGLYERFNEGVLASSLFMFGNMLLISFWYQLNFEERREEQNNANAYNDGYNNGYINGYNYNAYQWMDERERVAYFQKVTSYVCLALAVLFYAVAACIHSGSKILPEPGHGSSIQARACSHIKAQFDLLKDMWAFTSIASFVTFTGLFIAACILSGGEEADRMREEGRLVNLILILLCMTLITTLHLVLGSNVFTIEKGSDSLGMGLMYGSTKYFAALLLVVCILTANPTFDQRRREEGIWVNTATACASFILSLLHLIISMRTRQYQVSIIDASETNNAILDPNSGDFVRVEEGGLQI